MPTYSYQCKKCEAVVDHFHGINAKPRIKCEKCGTACKRLIGTGAGIIFKGTGFYETDYKQKIGKPDSKRESSTKSETKSKSSDSKTTPKSTASSKK